MLGHEVGTALSGLPFFGVRADGCPRTKQLPPQSPRHAGPLIEALTEPHNAPRGPERSLTQIPLHSFSFNLLSYSFSLPSSLFSLPSSFNLETAVATSRRVEGHVVSRLPANKGITHWVSANREPCHCELRTAFGGDSRKKGNSLHDSGADPAVWPTLDWCLCTRLRAWLRGQRRFDW